MEKSEKIKENQIENLLYLDVHGKFLHIKVGNREMPASDKMVKDIEDKIVKLLEDNGIDCVTFVTHHAVEIDIVESTKK